MSALRIEDGIHTFYDPKRPDLLAGLWNGRPFGPIVDMKDTRSNFVKVFAPTVYFMPNVGWLLTGTAVAG